MPHIFISYASKNHFFVDRLREDLKRAGISYWIDREGLSPGTISWERAIRQAIKDSHSVLWIVSPSAFESPYVRDEISIARMYKRTVYPVWAEGEHWLECVPLGTGEIQYIDGRSDYHAALTTICDAIEKSISTYAMPEEFAPELAPGKEPRNPYKGLVAFSEADAGDFFGREALIEKMGARLTNMVDNGKDRFLAVLGPSGAGKSSVVMAGLIPALKKAHPEWAFLPKMVPGTHPIEALADALYSTLPQQKSLSSIQADLSSPGGRMLHRLTAQAAGERLILYIDQFEELFTLTPDENERQQFITLLTQAATEPEGRAVILLSMRADFYGHPMNYPELGRLVDANNLGMLPMSITELRDAIEKPARLPDVGLTFDDGLVAEIVFALRERDKALAGALPLLQITLEHLYTKRDGANIGFEAYHGIGGVEGAIGSYCEEVFNHIPAESQDNLRQIFLPLVVINEDTGISTRQRVKYDTNSPHREIVERLIKSRLLQTGEDYLEIAHEAILRSWPRLSEWIQKNAEDRILLDRIRRRAQEWEDKGRPDYLRPRQQELVEIYQMFKRQNVSSDDEPLLKEFTESEIKRLLERLRKTTSEKKEIIGYVTVALKEIGATAIPGLIGYLSDKDEDVQNAAIKALGESEDRNVADFLIQLFPKLEARDALIQLGEYAAESLVHSLSDEKSTIRSNSALVLGELKSPQTIEPLIESLVDVDSDTRNNAIIALGKIAKSYQGRLESDDADSYGRIDAQLKLDMILKATLPMLNDPDEKVRKSTVETLGIIKDKNSIHLIISLLGGSGDEIRHSIFESLRSIGQPAIDILSKMLKNENVTVRRNAIDALKAFKNDVSINPIIAILRDEDFIVRAGAAEVLGNLQDKQAVQPLIAALHDDDAPPVREEAARALGRLQDEQAVQPLIAAFHGDDALTVREEAARALGRLQDEQAVQPSIAALHDDDDNIMPEEAKMLMNEALGTRLLILGVGDSDSSVRSKSIEYLIANGKLAVKFLKDALLDKDIQIRNNALAVLGKIDDDEARQAVSDHLFSRPIR